MTKWTVYPQSDSLSPGLEIDFVEDGQGRELPSSQLAAGDHLSVDYPGGADYFAEILSAYLEHGRGCAGVVGQARSELIDAVDLLRFGVAWMEEKL